MSFRDFLGIIRAPFLMLAVVCVLLGFSTAYHSGANLTIFNVILVFLGGIFAHIAVNSLNEYFDFKTGLDFLTIKTPFSGGSGTLVSKPHLSKYALLIGVFSIIIVISIGLFFVYLRGTTMLLIGLLGTLVIIIYPVVGVRNSFIALISPGLGFGTAMVLGTHYALSGNISISAIIASFIPFFLVNNLLLLNQLPDVEADKECGRSNVVIRFGRKKAVIIFSIFNLFAYITIVFGMLSGYFNTLSIVGLLTAFLAFNSSIQAMRFHSEIEKLIPALAMNVLTNLITPLLVAISFMIKI
ncbi:MAG: prenyltransferase [Myxococcota bacterium]